jgi:hypothetical protein
MCDENFNPLLIYAAGFRRFNNMGVPSKPLAEKFIEDLKNHIS